MGLVSTYHKIREYLKIYRYKATEETSRQSIFWELVKNRWRSLFALFSLIGISFALDVFVTNILIPIISNQSWFAFLSRYILFPDTQMTIGLLGAIVEGVAALIGLLLAISFVVLELAANRYPHSIVKFLIEEKVGAYLLDLLMATLLFSLWTLFLLRRGTIVPYFSISMCVLLTSFSVVFLFIYRKHSLHFFQPRQSFLIVTNEVKNKLRMVFEKGTELGQAVLTYMQKTVQERVFLMRDFLAVLLDSKDPDPEAAYGLLCLSSILSQYIERKRFINAQSAWFPTREVPIQEMGYALGLQQMSEELALGTRTRQEPNINWFDGLILDVFRKTQRHIIEKDEKQCLYGLIASYKEPIEKCFEHQEFSILDVVTGLVHDLGIGVTAKGYPEVSNEFYNLVMLIGEKAIQGSNLQSLRDVLTKILWQSDEEIALHRLPKTFHEELLSYRRKLETELAIEGSVLTPLSWIENDILDKVSKIEASNSRKSYYSAINMLSSINEKASSERCLSETRNALVAQLLLLRRALVMRRSELISENIDGVLKRVWNSYRDLSEERSLRFDIFKETKLACLNAIKMHQEESLRKFFAILSLISIQEFDQNRDTFAEDALEALLIILSLAFLGL